MHNCFKTPTVCCHPVIFPPSSMDRLMDPCWLCLFLLPCHQQFEIIDEFNQAPLFYSIIVIIVCNFNLIYPVQLTLKIPVFTKNNECLPKCCKIFFTAGEAQVWLIKPVMMAAVHSGVPVSGPCVVLCMQTHCRCVHFNGIRPPLMFFFFLHLCFSCYNKSKCLCGEKNSLLCGGP